MVTVIWVSPGITSLLVDTIPHSQVHSWIFRYPKEIKYVCWMSNVPSLKITVQRKANARRYRVVYHVILRGIQNRTWTSIPYPKWVQACVHPTEFGPAYSLKTSRTWLDVHRHLGPAKTTETWTRTCIRDTAWKHECCCKCSSQKDKHTKKDYIIITWYGLAVRIVSKTAWRACWYMASLVVLRSNVSLGRGCKIKKMFLNGILTQYRRAAPFL